MVTELGYFRVCYVQMLLSATAPNKKDWRDSLTNCICLVCPYQYCVPATHSADPSCRKHNWSTSSGHRSSFQRWRLPTMLLSYWLFSGQDLWYSPCPRLHVTVAFLLNTAVRGDVWTLQSDALTTRLLRHCCFGVKIYDTGWHRKNWNIQLMCTLRQCTVKMTKDMVYVSICNNYGFLFVCILNERFSENNN